MDHEHRPDTMSISEAHAQIRVLMQEIQIMGGNDSEMPTILGILRSLEKGALSPTEAVQMVSDMRAGKQDYH